MVRFIPSWLPLLPCQDIDVFIRVWVCFCNLHLLCVILVLFWFFLATDWSILKISACRALWERIGSSRNPICGRERPEFDQNAIFFFFFFLIYNFLLHTHRHTQSPQQQQGKSANSLWQRTKGDQSLLLNDAKRYDKKCIISLSDYIRLHTHLCEHTHIFMRAHTRTPHMLDISLNCLSRVWPTALMMCLVTRDAHFDIQLRCSLNFSLCWDDTLQILWFFGADS